MSDLVVGQKLWFVPSDRRWAKCHEVTVVKVGRKWAETDHRFRIDIETRRADGKGYSSPGTCWASQEEHEAHLAVVNAWRRFAGDVRDCYLPPKAATLEAIEQASRLLGFSPIAETPHENTAKMSEAKDVNQ